VLDGVDKILIGVAEAASGTGSVEGGAPEGCVMWRRTLGYSVNRLGRQVEPVGDIRGGRSFAPSNEHAVALSFRGRLSTLPVQSSGGLEAARLNTLLVQDLSDPLARDVEALTDLLQREGILFVERHD